MLLTCYPSTGIVPPRLTIQSLIKTSSCDRLGRPAPVAGAHHESYSRPETPLAGASGRFFDSRSETADGPGEQQTLSLDCAGHPSQLSFASGITASTTSGSRPLGTVW